MFALGFWLSNRTPGVQGEAEMKACDYERFVRCKQCGGEFDEATIPDRMAFASGAEYGTCPNCDASIEVYSPNEQFNPIGGGGG